MLIFVFVLHTQAIVCYNEAINVQAQWKQVHHLCWWELMWCYWYVCYPQSCMAERLYLTD